MRGTETSHQPHQACNEDVSDRTRWKEAEVTSFYSQVPVETDVIVPSEWHSSRHRPPARRSAVDERTDVSRPQLADPSTDPRTLLISSLSSSTLCHHGVERRCGILLGMRLDGMTLAGKRHRWRRNCCHIWAVHNFSVT